MRTFSVLTISLMMVVFSFSGTLLGQDTKVEVYEKIHIPHKKPIPYAYTREADVMWSKTIWRMVDLREKMNLPLFYPVTPIGERMSLISLIFFGIDNEGLSAYDPNNVDEFKVPLSKEDLELNMDNKAKTVEVQDTTGKMVNKDVKGERKTEEIKKILVKEKWFFDKNYSTMQVRMLGICPIRVYAKEVKGQEATADDANAEMTLKKICWIYYPEARNLFASHPVYNKFNDSQQGSFDDLFMQRRFTGIIYAESNVYNDRRIQEYTTGIETLLESDKIKESIMNLEHDLWEY